jgi:hypothetical protein
MAPDASTADTKANPEHGKQAWKPHSRVLLRKIWKDMSGDSPAKRRSLSKFRKNLEVAERDARACRLYYVDRMTYREVAEALGFANEGGAKRSADRGLKAIQVKGNEGLIAEVRARIAEGREFVKAVRDHPPQKVSPTGKPVFDLDGNPIYDDAVSLTAAAELRKEAGRPGNPLARPGAATQVHHGDDRRRPGRQASG